MRISVRNRVSVQPATGSESRITRRALVNKPRMHFHVHVQPRPRSKLLWAEESTYQVFCPSVCCKVICLHKLNIADITLQTWLTSVSV